MSEQTPSLTALICALGRSLHTHSDPLPILSDPWGALLVPDEFKARLHRVAAESLGHDGPTALDDWMRGNVFYPAVMVRARFTEEALNKALARGCRQYVLLGAGFDSYAIRRPPEFNDLSIYEIDQAATQSLKVAQLSKLALPPLERVHFVPADLARESLAEVLARTSFDVSRPAFFSWLGVSTYLTREANITTFKAIANNSAAGTELVFTYHDQISFEDAESPSSGAENSSPGKPSTTTVDGTTRWVRSVGEPFVSGFFPEEMSEVLRECGLELIEDIDDGQAVARYDTDNINQWRPQPIVRIAHARVL